MLPQSNECDYMASRQRGRKLERHVEGRENIPYIKTLIVHLFTSAVDNPPTFELLPVATVYHARELSSYFRNIPCTYSSELLASELDSRDEELLRALSIPLPALVKM